MALCKIPPQSDFITSSEWLPTKQRNLCDSGDTHQEQHQIISLLHTITFTNTHSTLLLLFDLLLFIYIEIFQQIYQFYFDPGQNNYVLKNSVQSFVQ